MAGGLLWLVVSTTALTALTAIRDDILIRTLGNQAPVRHVVAVTLSGYRSPATEAMLDVLRDTSDAYVADRQVSTAAKAS